MKNIARLSTLAATLVAIAMLSFSAGTVQAASAVTQPKPVQPPVVITPDSHPIPMCPPGDPNGCGIYN